MLKPAGTFSFAVGSLSAAAASGGAATGASFCAASLSGRPIIREPGGSGGAAGAGGAGWGGSGGGECTEKCAGQQRAARRQDCRHESPPLDRGGFDPRAGSLASRRGRPCRAQSVTFCPSRAIRKATASANRKSVRRNSPKVPVSMPGGVLVRQFDDGLGERKFQDDLAVVVHHLDDRAQQRRVFALTAKQFEHHGPR